MTQKLIFFKLRSRKEIWDFFTLYNYLPNWLLAIISKSTWVQIDFEQSFIIQSSITYSCFWFSFSFLFLFIWSRIHLCFRISCALYSGVTLIGVWKAGQAHARKVPYLLYFLSEPISPSWTNILIEIESIMFVSLTSS